MKPKKKKSNAGRPRIGQPKSVTFTEDQEVFLEAEAADQGESFCAVVRDLIEDARIRKLKKMGKAS